MTVADALTELQNQIDRFQRQVDICSEERLGRVEMDTGDIKRTQINLARQTRCEYSHLASFPRDFRIHDKTLTQLGIMEHLVVSEDNMKELLACYQAIYRLCASSSIFNTRNGKRK